MYGFRICGYSNDRRHTVFFKRFTANALGHPIQWPVADVHSGRSRIFTFGCRPMWPGWQLDWCNFESVEYDIIFIISLSLLTFLQVCIIEEDSTSEEPTTRWRLEYFLQSCKLGFLLLGQFMPEIIREWFWWQMMPLKYLKVTLINILHNAGLRLTEDMRVNFLIIVRYPICEWA